MHKGSNFSTSSLILFYFMFFFNLIFSSSHSNGHEVVALRFSNDFLKVHLYQIWGEEVGREARRAL